MPRTFLAVVAGLLAWFVVATVINLPLRVAWPEYAAAEPAMTFTLAMLLCRLVLGALASIVAGIIAIRIGRSSRAAIYALSLVLLVVFIPIHYSLWPLFPVWYHLVFLASLPILVGVGAATAGRRLAGA